MASVIPVNPVPLPIGDPISAPRKPLKGDSLSDVLQFLRAQDSQGFLTTTWQRWFGQQQQTISTASVRLNTIPLSAQSASIGATDFSGGSISGGLYQILIHARITQAAGATSSLIVALGWTEGGVAQSYSWPALTANLVTTVLLEPAVLIRVDTNAPITYTVTYASTGVPVMQYSLDLVLQRVAA